MRISRIQKTTEALAVWLKKGIKKHLTINQGLGGRWNLQWTPYEGAEYNTYIIYRGTNATDLQQIDIMPADGNTSLSIPSTAEP